MSDEYGGYDRENLKWAIYKKDRKPIMQLQTMILILLLIILSLNILIYLVYIPNIIGRIENKMGIYGEELIKLSNYIPNIITKMENYGENFNEYGKNLTAELKKISKILKNICSNSHFEGVC